MKHYNSHSELFNMPKTTNCKASNHATFQKTVVLTVLKVLTVLDVLTVLLGIAKGAIAPRQFCR
ncbi:hypothetical protein [Acidovorax delafieldii]|uniref:hypothetical protein n=1 Tax=Acidovorax delafieldii TaxID=47920 RepID=UPI003ECD5A26